MAETLSTAPETPNNYLVKALSGALSVLPNYKNDEQAAYRQAKKLANLLSFTPVGAAQAAYDAGNIMGEGARSGSIPQMAIGTGLAAMSAIPGPLRKGALLAGEDAVNLIPKNHVVVPVNLKDIIHGESAMPGGKLSWPSSDNLISNYASRKSAFPPIQLIKDEDAPNKWMIADGSHRFEAAKLRGDKTINAVMHQDDAKYFKNTK